MKTTQLTAPNGGFVPATTYVTGLDREGGVIEYGTIYMELRASGIIRRGHGVAWVNPTASIVPSIVAAPIATTAVNIVGIAMDGASAAGQYIRVAVSGFCLVWMNAQTVAGGEILVVPTTTAGEMIRAAAPVFDATVISGAILGRMFGIKDATSNLALCFLKQI